MKGDYIRTDVMDAQIILNGCKFVELDESNGSLYSVEEFAEEVDSRCILDYDGWGALVLDHNLVSNSSVVCHWKAVMLRDIGIVSFDTLIKLFGDRAEIQWYNK